ADGLAFGGGVAGAALVVRELHDHVRRGDLCTGGGRERRRAVGPLPGAGRCVVRVRGVVRSGETDVQGRGRIAGRRLVLPEVLEERLRRHGLAPLADQVGGVPEQVVRRRAGALAEHRVPGARLVDRIDGRLGGELYVGACAAGVRGHRAGGRRVGRVWRAAGT